MPYIKKEDRKKFNSILEQFDGIIDNEGELNYVITCLCHVFLGEHKENYRTHNTIMGVLSCVLQEFFKRKTSAYEDIKIMENGDV